MIVSMNVLHFVQNLLGINDVALTYL